MTFWDRTKVMFCPKKHIRIPRNDREKTPEVWAIFAPKIRTEGKEKP